MKRGVVAPALLALALALLSVQAAACGPACRDVDVQPLPVECDADSQFRNEIHIDSAATWSTFLRDQCMTSAEDSTRDALVEAVDFGGDAVFVASRERFETARCIEQRAVERVESCEDGLRITFVDETSDATPCPGRWTVAFSLPRAALRTAIQ